MCQVPLVLDKSFLRSVPTKRLQDISKFHKILISDALTYEVAKDVDKTRAQLFSKLDAIKDEIEYIPIIGELIRNVALFCGEWLTFRYFQVYQLFLFDIRSVIKVSMSFWVTQKWRKKFITIFTI